MQQKEQKTKVAEKILNTAFECLSTRGYANVTMRNIADDAGVALGQMTYYFKSKEALFLKVIHMMERQYLHEVESRLESTSDEKQMLAALVAFFKELVRDNPKFFRLFIDFTAQALWSPPFREQLDNLFRNLTELIERNMKIGTESNDRYHGYSPQSVAKLILGALLGTSIQIILGYDRDDSFKCLLLVESLIN